MKEIPSSYITLQKQNTYLKVRRWLRNGLSEKDMAAQLTKRYAKTESPTERLFIGHLLTYAYYKQLPIANTAAALFSIPVFRGFSPAESSFVANDIRFSKSYVLPDEDEDTIIPAKHCESIIPKENRSDVKFLSDNMYFFKSDYGIDIFCIEDCPADILVDEERFVNDAPLYFTEHSHFISPVYKLGVMRTIISFLLAEIGYPPIIINCTAVFTNGQIVNYDDYDSAGDGGWNNVRVVQLLTAREPVFSYIKHPEERLDIPALLHLNYILELSLHGAAIIYNNLAKGQFSVEPTDEVLKEYVKKLRFFKRGKD